MSILTDIVRSACFHEGQTVTLLESDMELRFPVAENPRTTKGTSRQLNRIKG